MQPLAGHVVILMGTGPGSSLGYPSRDLFGFGLVWYIHLSLPTTYDIIYEMLLKSQAGNLPEPWTGPSPTQPPLRHVSKDDERKILETPIVKLPQKVERI